MNINNLKIKVLVLKNKRLNFENAYLKVEDFIIKRLSHFGINEIEFIESNEEISKHFEDEKNNFLALVDVLNPFTDFELLEEMCNRLSRTNKFKCISEGAVPGTEISAVYNLRSSQNSESIIVRYQSQLIYNNQINIFKYKRLKQFLILIDYQKDIYKSSIKELFEILCEEKIFNLLVSFGENVQLGFYEKCPYCNHQLNPLYNTMSQPFCGYIPSNKALYHECENCGLVLSSPFVVADDISKVYDKWDKQDFVLTTNNPYTNDSIRCDLSKILTHLPENAKTLDLGGGIGNFSKYLSEQYLKWDVTHSDFAIKSKVEGRIKSIALDFTNEEIEKNAYNLITAWEVVEHIPFEKFDAVMNNIFNALQPGGFFKFSTPDFDSPACKSFDFYALCPPFHYTVLGELWLKNYFKNSNKFEIFDIKHCSDFLDDAINWYGYGERTATSMSVRNTSTLLKNIFINDKDQSVKKKLIEAGLGTEVIFTLRKK